MLLDVMARHGTQRLFVLAHPMIRERINAMLAEVGGHAGGGGGGSGQPSLQLRDAGVYLEWKCTAHLTYIHRYRFSHNFVLAISLGQTARYPFSPTLPYPSSPSLVSLATATYCHSVRCDPRLH